MRHLSAQEQRVLLLFLQHPRRERYGLEIAKEANLLRGTLYPILERMEARGWLTSVWEEIDPSRVGRRPRRYYKLTGDGLREARRCREEVLGDLGLKIALA